MAARSAMLPRSLAACRGPRGRSAWATLAGLLTGSLARDLGRGLGLPSALGLLQAHRAGLHVLLREGGGLAFRIHLPLVGS